MIKVFTATNPTEAHLVKGFLCSHGIHAEVRGEWLFTLEGATTIPGMQPAVWVPEEEEELRRARAVLRHFQGEPQDPSAASWVCSRCGEVLEAQFTDCWKCGTPRPTPGN